MAATLPAETPIAVGEEVAAAVADGRPVLALESTIITHGLPKPRNLDLALELEDQLRAAGVVPATIGVYAGLPTVGLTKGQIELLATADDVVKASVRDLPLAVATGRHAGTTVALTSYLAVAAGVRVFATGGLGGVHRGASETYDESADLPTLARTPITVVCAGVKSILDVGATLERLETLGVTLAAYRTRRFPGFYVTDSGFTVDWQVDTPDEVAATMTAADALGLKSGIVVANPVPEADQLDPAVHDEVLTRALEAAAQEGVRGKAVTPFLLDYFQRATSGESLEANIRAVRNNVALAAEIAQAWARRG